MIDKGIMIKKKTKNKKESQVKKINKIKNRNEKREAMEDKAKKEFKEFIQGRNEKVRTGAGFFNLTCKKKDGDIIYSIPKDVLDLGNRWYNLFGSSLLEVVGDENVLLGIFEDQMKRYIKYSEEGIGLNAGPDAHVEKRVEHFFIATENRYGEPSAKEAANITATYDNFHIPLIYEGRANFNDLVTKDDPTMIKVLAHNLLFNMLDRKLVNMVLVKKEEKNNKNTIVNNVKNNEEDKKEDVKEEGKIGFAEIDMDNIDLPFDGEEEATRLFFVFTLLAVCDYDVLEAFFDNINDKEKKYFDSFNEDTFKNYTFDEKKIKKLIITVIERAKYFSIEEKDIANCLIDTFTKWKQFIECRREQLKDGFCYYKQSSSRSEFWPKYLADYDLKDGKLLNWQVQDKDLKIKDPKLQKAIIKALDKTLETLKCVKNKEYIKEKVKKHLNVLKKIAEKKEKEIKYEDLSGVSSDEESNEEDKKHDGSYDKERKKISFEGYTGCACNIGCNCTIF